MALGRQTPAGRLTLALHRGAGEGVGSLGADARLDLPQLTLKAGYAREAGTLFGTATGRGALALGRGARTGFVEASRNLRAGRWSLAGYAGLAATRLTLDDALLLTRADTLVSTRFGLMAGYDAGAAGHFTLGVAQPLVVVSGDAHFTVPTGYALETRSLTYQSRGADLSGSVSPQLVAGYERAGRRSTLDPGARFDPATGAATALLGWRLVLGE